MIRGVLIGLSILAGCDPTPPQLTVGPACQQNAPGCLGAYQPLDSTTDERVLADHALCRAVPP